ncbi:hypothetical protein [Polymorphum gilvum]|uniref:Uncharacterized protein n=1 Tax=Polymorphum gilvum (strain LMG 25793 / CGMCC 1.9160 / SL003B-26A1) TaxID=991905 RepID=F2IXA3_POLGS|nr:hypothetical protein [Polymorphum gilvum]ADZ70421.1 hypothetical protein SL003B_1995 [Polymorphum gilvum SL003B-26A1]
MNQEITRDTMLALGATVARIVGKADTRAERLEDTRAALSDAGVSAETLGRIEVCADAADLVHLVVPASVDTAKIAAGDEAYLEELGRKALGSCFYDVLPE